jgi:hypothetical protein
MGFGGLFNLRLEGGNCPTNLELGSVKRVLRVESRPVWFMKAEVVYE